MWRSDCESRILNTQVPAGNTPHPLRWTPGISTGALKVITVFLFQPSAFAAGEDTTPISARQNTLVVNAFETLICFCSFVLNSGAIGSSLYRAPCLQDLGGLVARWARSIPRSIGTIRARRTRLSLRSRHVCCTLEDMRRGARAENRSVALPPELSVHAVIAVRNAGIAADCATRPRPLIY